MTRAPRRPRGKLGPEDEALWREVTRRATPLHPAGRGPGGVHSGDDPLPPPPVAAPTAGPEAPPKVPASRRLRPHAPATPPAARTGLARVDLTECDLSPVGRPAAGLDRRTAERLRRGLRQPGLRLDLHGMTAERAHLALDRCIARALAEGERLILVITGKGGRRRGPDDAPFMREDRGVLRQQAPEWLRSGPHARHIVGIYQAHQRHGGAGAFYVYLKKRR